MKTTTTKTRSRIARLGALICACVAILVIQAPAASAEVKWYSDMWWSPTHLQEGEKGYFSLLIANVGDTQAGPPSVSIQLPSGLTSDGDFVNADPNLAGPDPRQWSCSGGGTSTINCVPGNDPKSALPFGRLEKGKYLRFAVDVAPDSMGLKQIGVTVSGGGAAQPGVESFPVKVSTTPLGFGVDADTLRAGAYDSSGAEFTLAGGHPEDASAALRFSTLAFPGFGFYAEQKIPGHSMADIVATLPPGFVGNPTAVTQCTAAQFVSSQGCPLESQVGSIKLNAPAIPEDQSAAVYSVVPPPGKPARFAFEVPFAATVLIDPSVRADGDYGITMTVAGVHEGDILAGSKLTIWGTPADPGHDEERCGLPNPYTFTCTRATAFGTPVALDDPTVVNPQGEFYPNPSALPERSLLSMPTNCADTPSTSFLLSTYENRPVDISNIDDPKWFRNKVTHADHTNCAAVPFDPTIDFEPGEKRSDTPTDLKVNLHFPRSEDRNNNGIPDDSDPAGLIQAHLKKTKVTLPAGFAFNASAGDGLAGCTPEQIGLRSAPGETPIRFNNAEPNCPRAAKVANAVVTTPVLPDTLDGEVFLASQDANPFDSTFAIYITVREPSILVKLPGLVELDPNTGQITTTFDENPQLPFSDLDLDFFGGPRASLATPKTCGTFNTRTEFVPWSAVDPDNPAPSEIEVSNDTFEITQGAGGQGCASSLGQLPLGVGFEAGSQNPLAGKSTAFSLRVTRPDGHQDLDRLELGMPTGFTAVLKGVPYCAEAAIASISSRSGREEESSSACGSASQIGTTIAGAGAGSLPLYRPGKLYLAGPYKGSPLSVVAVTPAVAGPFDLGSVVVRSRLLIDPKTAKVTAITDPLPQTLEGVPLRIRDVRIAIDRGDFAINPTNCAALASSVKAFGANGAVSEASAPFNAQGCKDLQFKPGLSIALKGGTKRGDHPSIQAIALPRPGDANISRAAVTLPSSAFLDQAHIRTICTRVQFATDNCPKAAIYGKASAWSPLLDEPLTGPVYLRSSDNELPDIVADLRGPASQPIKVELVGRVDSVKGGIRNTFEATPDAAVSKFVLEMQGGQKGLIVNSKNLCAGTNRATARLSAHNGRRHNFKPVVKPQGCKKAKQKGAKRKG